ncbi:MAG: hypothetical protein Q8N47_02240 [Bryobacterales bacterium]|nr:hypothetical protein [Bryobacterales bacterium]
MIHRFILAVCLFLVSANAREITVSGTRFLIDGKPFPYTGISFFNAIYNPAFNRSGEERAKWLEKFQRYGINVLRVWSQWDSKRGFVDACPECTLYYPDGRLREASLERLKQIAADADRAGMVIELVLFSQESWHDQIRLGPAESDRAVAAITRELRPWRNLTFQVWNEFSERVLDHIKTIRASDPKRLVTNSPGFAGVLGDQEQNRAVDYLTPHTSRQGAGKTWEIAPKEIEYLLARYRKPVVDDEPARNGTPNFGGPKERTWPADHIVQIYQVWQAGAHITYHHDMFQTGYHSPAVPPSGVPDPEFSPYHGAVFEFIALRERYMPAR